MSHLDRVLKDLEFKATKNDEKDVFMTRTFEGGMKAMAWDLKNPKKFDPETNSTVMIALVAPDGSFIDATKITSIFHAKDLVRDWNVIAEATRFKQAPEGKGAHFALFDKENDGYAIIASRHPGFEFGATLYSVRSQYLRQTDPDSQGLVGRYENVLSAMQALETQIQVDYDHAMEAAPSM
ncbi:hypothetical protein [Sulfitobacter sp. R18_1]|uniref:hypothetical protein n=1 Tax=Sulfitobacter sp. R18_1 TaxID=2821104 RepID=UPI001AD9E18E|nr:hypothetical protein [Sulfitobacter sp. R18_1]MBO9428734.1 hypothetical protein [Sulfitobacter sp. R18_1]